MGGERKPQFIYIPRKRRRIRLDDETCDGNFREEHPTSPYPSWTNEFLFFINLGFSDVHLIDGRRLKKKKASRRFLEGMDRYGGVISREKLPATLKPDRSVISTAIKKSRSSSSNARAFRIGALMN